MALKEDQDQPENPANPAHPPKKRRWLRRLLVVVLAIAALLLWLNGPGIRWLGPVAANHYLGKLGIEGDFTLEGNLLGGVSVANLKIGGGTIPGEIKALKIVPLYRFRDALRGQFEGIKIENLHAVIDLDQQRPDKPQTTSEPFDPAKLAQILRNLRARVVPLEIQLSNIRIDVVNSGKHFVSIADSSFRHSPGAADFHLDLGETKDPAFRTWPAQQTTLSWQPEQIAVDKIDPLPAIGIRDFILHIPSSGEPSAETRLVVENAVLHASTGPGFREVRADLREGKLEIEPLLTRFGIDLPLRGTVASFALNASHFPARPEAELRILLENADYAGWQVSELNLDGQLLVDSLRLHARGRSLGSEIQIDAAAPLERAPGFQIGDIAGNLAIADVPKVWRELTKKFPSLHAAADVPPSSLSGTFGFAMQGTEKGKVSADLHLRPLDPTAATPLHLIAAWQNGQPFDASLKADGLSAKVHFDSRWENYQTHVSWDEFRKTRIDRWLTLAKIKIDGEARLTGELHSTGNLRAKTHTGTLALTHGSWLQPDRPAITLDGHLEFEWPQQLKATNLRAISGSQKIELDAFMANGELNVPRLVFHENNARLLDGKMTFPLPADFARWKETIAHDTRPVQVAIESQVLALQSLKNWIPALATIDPAATGQVKLTVSGTYGNPEIEGAFAFKNVRRTAEKKIPVADFTLDFNGGSGKLDASGRIVTPDYDPATLNFRADFFPAEWAAKPELIKTAAIDARLDLPAVNLSRLNGIIPKIREIRGTLDGHAIVTGTLGKPDARGNIRLSGGHLALADKLYPPVQNIAMNVDLAMDRVTLKTLQATAAGGTISAAGSVPIVKGAAGPIDLRLKGDHLLVKRDDKVVVRSNADLRLAGAFETATISGTIDVVDSLFFRDVELIPVGVPFIGPTAASLPKLDSPKSVIPALPAPLNDWKLAVRVRTGMPFLIRGNLGTGSITANLNVTGTAGSPEPRGEVLIDRAELALPYTTLRVRRGIVRFTGDLDPDLEIRGTAEPRPYKVFVYVYGSPENPQLVLTSSPPLPQNEIMTLLATGTTSSGLEDSKMATSRALQLLAEEVRRGRVKIARPLRPLLRYADRIDFTLADEDPYTSAKFSSATIAFTDRWLLSASMGEDGESRIMGIWRLTFR